jgi:hypothetical protein
MKILIGGRASGKTYQAIKLASEQDSVIVVPTKTQVSRLVATAKYLEIPLRTPVTMEALLRLKSEDPKAVASEKYLIEDVEQCLKAVLPNVQAVTVAAESFELTSVLHNDSNKSSISVYTKVKIP